MSEYSRRVVAVQEQLGVIVDDADPRLDIIEAVMNGAPTALVRDYIDEGVHFRIYQVESALVEDTEPSTDVDKCGHGTGVASEGGE